MTMHVSIAGTLGTPPSYIASRSYSRCSYVVTIILPKQSCQSVAPMFDVRHQSWCCKHDVGCEMCECEWTRRDLSQLKSQLARYPAPPGFFSKASLTRLLRFCWKRILYSPGFFCLRQKKAVVDSEGFEPSTPRLQSGCSSN